ncbi:MAG: hypothetical protein A2494_00440 [Candidatus Lloydbacteria bacterium RIFOXYC12_FULL_46_25]|uniref:VTT domain-containing protein n=1 Tax=Candidatus Lloydbacteria bacterium RIFOXYC12_FULL_46_25 TaxID=1798670 RepID=A0A1G2DYI3_9BACT|nr:MAG: hypothetical protein A2494_00440 [Candidatus Lloydbacteria bacterium RIFOXYC12_FULL_46_25]
MFDLMGIIATAGYIGLFAIVFAESGLFFGFFLPGDSLLFTAGLVASQGGLNILVLVPLLFVAAVTGDNVGYAFGQRVGEKIFAKKESRFFKPAHVTRAHEFFLKYGKKAIVLARFMPIVRTFTPIVAGVAKMPYADFFLYNLIGGAAWTTSMLLFGYFLGKKMPNAEHYLYPIVIAIIIVSFLPALLEFYKARKK